MNFAASLGALQVLHRFAPPDETDGAGAQKPKGLPDPALWDDLPFKVELWNADKASVDLVLAVTASGNIGFAAYHAATREFPDRYIVLRHNDAVLARWNSPAH
jgi:hypothetical protein